MFARGAGCLSIVLLASASWAGPVDRSTVVANPAWVAHLNADALRGSEIGKQLLVEMNKPEASIGFDMLIAAIGTDLRTALHGVTLYGISPEPADGVALVYADINAERLLTLAKSAQDYKSSTHGEDQVHSWIDAKRRKQVGGQPRTFASIYDNRIVIFAQRESRVTEALDTLRKAKPGLADTTFADFGRNSDSIFQACGHHMDLGTKDPHAAFLKLSQEAALDFQETGGKAQATLALQAVNDETAEQMSNIAKGLLSLLALQTNNAPAVKLAKSLTVQQAGSSVTVQLSVNTDDVVAAIKADAAKKERRKHRHEAQADASKENN
jgi:hypothetical protein